MEHRTSNPEPSWPQSAYTRAYAAAELGSDLLFQTHGHDGNGLNAVPAICQDHNPWSSVSTSFVDQQLGDSNSVSRSASAENNRISLVDYGHYNAYDSVATPSNFTRADPWAPSPPNDHAFGPFISSNTLQLTGSTFRAGFGAGAADNNGTALPTSPIPYAWGAAIPTAHSDNNTSAPFVDSNFSPLTDNTFAANASYNGGITYPTAPNAYTGLAGAPAGPMNNNTFAPFVSSNLSPLTASTFDANTAYNGGIAYSTAPNAYTGSVAAPRGPMNPYMGPGFNYPDLGPPMMDPLAADNNGSSYHGQFPTATSFNTQPGAAIEPPNSFHTTHASHAAPRISSQHAQQPSPTLRPTCATCSRNFRRKADLARHAKKHKADAEVFQCSCRYSSYRKDKLDEHVRRSGHRAAAGVDLEGV